MHLTVGTRRVFRQFSGFELSPFRKGVHAPTHRKLRKPLTRDEDTMKRPEKTKDMEEIMHLPFGEMKMLGARVFYGIDEKWPKDINYSGYSYPNVEIVYQDMDDAEIELVIVFPACEWFMYPMFMDLSLVNSKFSRLGTFEVSDNEYTRIKSAAILYEYRKSAQQGDALEPASPSLPQRR